jgi:hypothetical protein
MISSTKGCTLASRDEPSNSQSLHERRRQLVLGLPDDSSRASTPGSRNLRYETITTFSLGLCNSESRQVDRTTKQHDPKVETAQFEKPEALSRSFPARCSSTCPYPSSTFSAWSLTGGATEPWRGKNITISISRPYSSRD